MSKHETITIISPCESDLQAWTFQISAEDLAALAEKYGHTGSSVRCPAAHIAEEVRDIYKAEGAEDTDPHGATRRVETPVGQLVAYPSHEENDPADYPGIFVDIITPEGEKRMLARVEYDSVAGDILAAFYGSADSDEPTDIRHCCGTAEQGDSGDDSPYSVAFWCGSYVFATRGYDTAEEACAAAVHFDIDENCDLAQVLRSNPADAEHDDEIMWLNDANECEISVDEGDPDFTIAQAALEEVGL